MTEQDFEYIADLLSNCFAEDTLEAHIEFMVEETQFTLEQCNKIFNAWMAMDPKSQLSLSFNLADFRTWLNKVLA